MDEGLLTSENLSAESFSETLETAYMDPQQTEKGFLSVREYYNYYLCWPKSRERIQVSASLNSKEETENDAKLLQHFMA
jgi:hypothetical protein